MQSQALKGQPPLGKLGNLLQILWLQKKINPAPIKLLSLSILTEQMHINYQK
jgi:hypothetical protein